jgi:hypothetical protein
MSFGYGSTVREPEIKNIFHFTFEISHLSSLEPTPGADFRRRLERALVPSREVDKSAC